MKTHCGESAQFGILLLTRLKETWLYFYHTSPGTPPFSPLTFIILIHRFHQPPVNSLLRSSSPIILPAVMFIDISSTFAYSYLSPSAVSISNIEAISDTASKNKLIMNTGFPDILVYSLDFSTGVLHTLHMQVETIQTRLIYWTKSHFFHRCCLRTNTPRVHVLFFYSKYSKVRG